MDTLTVYAVMSEGHIPSYITKDGRGIISCTSYWETLAEAEFARDRKFGGNMGTWTPRKRWIETREFGYDEIDRISCLDNNAPEMATR
jgi:hypothetical protein